MVTFLCIRNGSRCSEGCMVTMPGDWSLMTVTSQERHPSQLAASHSAACPALSGLASVLRARRGGGLPGGGRKVGWHPDSRTLPSTTRMSSHLQNFSEFPDMPVLIALKFD